MSNASQIMLAMAVYKWLEDNGCAVQLQKGQGEHQGNYLIHYTLRLDVNPQPPIVITNKPSIKVPTGSQEAVVTSMLNWIARGTSDGEA